LPQKKKTFKGLALSYLFFLREMFRKARDISRKLGIHHSTSDYEVSDEEHSNNNLQPFLIKVDTTGSKQNDSPLPSHDLDLQLPDTNRPMLTTCKSAPDDLPGQQNSTNNLTTVLSLPPQPDLLSPRPTHITFALPVTPQRSKSPSAIAYPKARPVRSLSDDEMTVNQARHTTRRPRRSGWRLFHDRDDDNEPVHQHLPIFVGTRVRLKLRPLPTVGTVRYIGAVHFDTGEYIGVELDYGGKSAYISTTLTNII
jgi:hypothetical protein